MTTKPHRIQLSRARGWRMPPNTIKVDRRTVFGNPFTIEDFKRATIDTPDIVAAKHVTDIFRAWIAGKPPSGVQQDIFGFIDGPALTLRRAQILARLDELRGFNLACWCSPHRPCHADILLELANAPSRIHAPGAERAPEGAKS